jgi:hypothetical protein
MSGFDIIFLIMVNLSDECAPVRNMFLFISTKFADYIEHMAQDDTDNNAGYNGEMEAEVLSLYVDIPRRRRG